ncbi:MAG: hypothetical protein ACTSQJ_10175 [Promethearchaeota archaeon]
MFNFCKKWGDFLNMIENIGAGGGFILGPALFILDETIPENVKAINEEIVDILKSAFGAREIRMKLRELEFDEKEMAENFPL